MQHRGKKSTCTAQTVVEAIRQAGAEMGRKPKKKECLERPGFTENGLFRHFASWNAALRAAGFDEDTLRRRIDDSALLTGWGTMVRQLGGIPSVMMYAERGGKNQTILRLRFGGWSKLPDRFREFARGKAEWADVVGIIKKGVSARKQSLAGLMVSQASRTAPRAGDSLLSAGVHRRLPQRTGYGDPIDVPGFRHQPTDEMGVVFLFAVLCCKLGYTVEHVQTHFPDCTAKRRVGENRWEVVRIEFEFESRNFRAHAHPVDGCDVIVCWKHNWVGCPPGLEVLELSSVVKAWH